MLIKKRAKSETIMMTAKASYHYNGYNKERKETTT